jgi:hypothetical protein
VKNSGSPDWLPPGGCMNERHTDIEALKGKPGNGTMQQSKRAWQRSGNGQALSRMPPGCLIRHSTQIMGKP